ncbi:MAG: hypothetical protein NTY19_18780 [Planctomycetota bacterium]|nr:hypothetical protein [Planctomycetota bacterium]
MATARNDDTGRDTIYDPVFWKNYARHLKAMVDRDKNRPAVIMWSLENEFLGGRLNDASPAKKDLVRMGRLVKAHDPTRPIFFESDGDPDGVADVIGIHYPHEYPDFTCWPNEALWLQSPAKIPHMFLNGAPEFVWRKDKPIYVGEFLWIPSRDPSWHTVFFGDEAYIDYQRYRNLAKAESWKMQILGYRHLEVGGISPWTVIEGGPLDETNPLFRAQQYAYQPVAAYPLDYDRRFYSGETVVRRVDLFHEIPDRSALELSWTLTRGDQVLDRGLLPPVSLDVRQSSSVQLHMPQVERRTEVDWQLTIRRNGQPVFQDTHHWAVFPKLRFPAVHAAIGLWDPEGTTQRVFTAAGLRATAVAELTQLPADMEVLVIGAGALRAAPQGVPVIGRVAPERAVLEKFLNRGGRILVLRQDAYPEGLFDVMLTQHRSTMTFPQRPDHPALREVAADDLKFWRGDHLVATDELARPSTGGAVPIVVSGSAAGIDHAPLLERRVGWGRLVHSQLALVEKFDTEPAAARILVNLVEYLTQAGNNQAGLASPAGQPGLKNGATADARKTAVVGGTEAYRCYLRSLGLQFDDLTGKLDAIDWAAYGLVLCRGELPGLEELGPWVENGGRLWLHRTPVASLEHVCHEWKLDLVAQPYAGAVTRAEGDHPLLAALAREDLYWLGKHVGIDWADTPRATAMADLIFSKSLGDKRAVEYEVEDWKLEGEIIQRQPPGVIFATVGSATQEIAFPTAGDYLIGVLARGTPCFGVYPIVQVAIDGKPFGQISVTDRWQTTCVFGRVTAGRHKVSVSFINDAGDPPREDRNLYVDKVLIARDENTSGVHFLASPAALAVAARGKGLVVLDQICWDTEEPNARKAARFASALLIELGGRFAPRGGATIRCDRMTPQPEMPFFRNQGGSASLACNGYVETPIQVAVAGPYSVEIVASGTSAQGVYPLVEVAIDGQTVGKIQLTAGSWRSYFLDLDLAEGVHKFRLSFVNDTNVNGEDRNLLLDKVTFFAASKRGP